LIVILETISLEFPTEIFLVACARETLINEWDARGTDINEGVLSFGWKGQEEEWWWKIGIVVGEYEWTVRDHPLLWISSLSSRVTGC
jgi:hypothetical protein